MICVYVGSLLLVLSVSLAFNMAPGAPIKRLLAHFDQAAIFLLIAGTQTPLLALLGNTPTSIIMLIVIWSGFAGDRLEADRAPAFRPTGTRAPLGDRVERRGYLPVPGECP